MSSNWGHLTTKVVIKTKYLKKVLHCFVYFIRAMKLFTVVVYHDQRQVLSSHTREVPKNALFKLH